MLFSCVINFSNLVFVILWSVFPLQFPAQHSGLSNELGAFLAPRLGSQMSSELQALIFPLEAQGREVL